MRKVNKGFSYLEFIVAITLVFIFIAFALKMLVKFAVEAEQVAMQEVVQTLDKAIMNLTAEHLLENDMAGLAKWDGANPMDMLPIKAENYAGKFSERDNKPDTGNWYYDYSNEKLVYGVKHQRNFISENGENTRAEYQLKFIYADNNGNGKFDVNHDEPQGLKLVPASQYQWVE